MNTISKRIIWSKRTSSIFDQFLVNVKLANGDWKEIVSIQKIRNRMKKEKSLSDAVEEINHLAYRLSEEGPRPSFVGSFIKPEITYVFHRGSPKIPELWCSLEPQRYYPVTWGWTTEPAAVQGWAKFADWMMNDKNPLTARVMANRIWQHVFGAGLVVTGGDFGRAGAMPRAILNYWTGSRRNFRIPHVLMGHRGQ